MSGPVPPRRYHPGTVAMASMTAWDAVSALTYVTSDHMWPAFAAWAEQLEPSEQWTEADRDRMSLSARHFLELAEVADRIMGRPADE